MDFENKDNFKKYINSLKSEVNSRDNKDELNKKLILTDDAILNISSRMTTDEYDNIIKKVGKKGYWYNQICTIEEIKRVLNPKCCEDILLSKQANYIIEHSRTYRVFLKRKQIYEQQGENWTLTNFYKNDKNFNQYLNILKPHIKRKCKTVNTGFVFMIEPNGICEKTKFGNIIYLSESLSYFLHFMNFAMLDFYNFQMDTEQHMEALYIGIRVMLGVESLDFDLDPRYDNIPEEVINANNNFVEKQLMFIIGHEYAHHSLDHLNNAKIHHISINDIFMTETQKNKFYNYSQKHEFEADWFAFKNTKLRKEEQEEMLNGAFFFFIYIDIFDYVKEYIFPSVNIYNTHPKPLDRLWKLRKKIRNGIGYNKKELNEFINHAKDIKIALLQNILPYRADLFEFTGSVYMSKYKTKKLIDRIDY